MKKSYLLFIIIGFLFIPIQILLSQDPSPDPAPTEFACDEPAQGKASFRKRCGVRGTNNLMIVCDNSSTSGLVCSSNEFNPCKTRVCLKATGSVCDNNRDCEGGSVCNRKIGSSTGICDTSPDDDTSSSGDLRDTIRRIINIVLGFLGIITVIMVMYGGFSWLTAAGNEEAVSKGRHTLLWAALGALLIGIAWTVSSYILSVAEKVG